MDTNSNSDNFDKAIEVYLLQIESLWTTLPNVLKTIEKAQNESSKKYNDFLKNNCEYVEAENHYIISIGNLRRNRILKKEAENNKMAYKIIKRNFVVSLISQFDTYIGSLMKCVFLIKPELINESEKQLTYAQLKTFNNLEDAKDYVIEKEIETVLRDSHTEQMKWFEKKLSINLLKDLPIWITFIELTQRRNLFVHTDGKVTSQYMNVCKENKVPLPEDLKIGHTLDAELEYFKKAFICLFEIGLKLNQVLRRNLLKNQIIEADNSFLNISFELIQNGQYELAKEIYDFADKYIKKYSSNNIAFRIALNRAQTYKWLNQNGKCIEIIDSIDWSATGDLFKLGSSVLKDDFDNAFAAMRSIGDNEKIIHKSSYRDWPIFKEFVCNPGFKATYKDIFEEDFEITEEENAA